MDNEMKIVTQNGKQVDCNIVAVFHDGRQNYVAYTDNTVGSDGKKELLVSKFEKVGKEAHIRNIESDEEWEFVENYLDRKVFGDDFYETRDI